MKKTLALLMTLCMIFAVCAVSVASAFGTYGVAVADGADALAVADLAAPCAVACGALALARAVAGGARACAAACGAGDGCGAVVDFPHAVAYAAPSAAAARVAVAGA